ncbi:unnamed protein product, partial [Mesorhabditis spiculigera]
MTAPWRIYTTGDLLRNIYFVYEPKQINKPVPMNASEAPDSGPKNAPASPTPAMQPTRSTTATPAHNSLANEMPPEKRKKRRRHSQQSTASSRAKMTYRRTCHPKQLEFD